MCPCKIIFPPRKKSILNCFLRPQIYPRCYLYIVPFFFMYTRDGISQIYPHYLHAVYTFNMWKKVGEFKDISIYMGSVTRDLSHSNTYQLFVEENPRAVKTICQFAGMVREPKRC